MAHQARAYSSFSSMKGLGVFYSPLDRMLVHHRVTPNNKFAGTILYTWVERGTVRVKRLAQEHNTMFPARARTQTTCSWSSALTMRPLHLPLHPGVHLYKWVPANLMLVVTLRWTNTPSRGSRDSPSWFMLQKLEISTGLVCH